MLGPFATTSRLTPIHQVSPLYCRTPPAHRCPRRQRRRRTTTTTTTTRDRGDRYGPIEWAQQEKRKQVTRSKRKQVIMETNTKTIYIVPKFTQNL